MCFIKGINLCRHLVNIEYIHCQILFMKQNYRNHSFYYPPHHFIFYPLCFLQLGICGYGAITYREHMLLWMAIGFVSFLIMWFSFMSRQHYALGNQNRIVRLEMRLRYFILTGKRFEAVEPSLSFAQIAALRFAGDEELVELIEKTMRENTAPDAIKKSIKNWNADLMRV